MLGYLIGAGVGFIIVVLLCIWKFGFKKTPGISDEERNHVRMHAYDINFIFANRVSSQEVNNNIWPEQDDTSQQYLLPANSDHLQTPVPTSELTSVSIQMPTSPQELTDRPPTYRT
jgi:hypothetical protein